MGWVAPSRLKCLAKPCGQRYAGNWKGAQKGCVLICKALMRNGLKFPASIACDRLCKAQCKKAAPGKPLSWGQCDNYPVSGDPGHGSGPSCAACCEANCNGKRICLEQCVTSCCGGDYD